MRGTIELDGETDGHYGRAMDIRKRNTPTRQELEKAIEQVGGEPLDGSGFEDETPDPEFNETIPVEPQSPR